MNTITYQYNPKKVAALKRNILKILLFNLFISIMYALMGKIVFPSILGGISVIGLFILLLEHFSFIKKAYIEINEIGIKCSSSQYKIIPWGDVEDLKVFMLKTTPFLLINLKNNNDYLMKLNILRKFLASVSMKRTKAIFAESLKFYSEDPNTILNDCLKFAHKKR